MMMCSYYEFNRPLTQIGGCPENTIYILNTNYMEWLEYGLYFKHICTFGFRNQYRCSQLFTFPNSEYLNTEIVYTAHTDIRFPQPQGHL